MLRIEFAVPLLGIFLGSFCSSQTQAYNVKIPKIDSPELSEFVCTGSKNKFENICQKITEICCGEDSRCINELEKTGIQVLDGNKSGVGQSGYYHYGKKFIGVYKPSFLVVYCDDTDGRNKKNPQGKSLI